MEKNSYEKTLIAALVMSSVSLRTQMKQRNKLDLIEQRLGYRHWHQCLERVMSQETSQTSDIETVRPVSKTSCCWKRRQKWPNGWSGVLNHSSLPARTNGKNSAWKEDKALKKAQAGYARGLAKRERPEDGVKKPNPVALILHTIWAIARKKWRNKTRLRKLEPLRTWRHLSDGRASQFEQLIAILRRSVEDHFSTFNGVYHLVGTEGLQTLWPVGPSK